MNQQSNQSVPSAAAPAVPPLWTLAGPGLGAVLAAGQLGILLGPLPGELQHDFGLSTAMVMIAAVAQVAAAVVGIPLGYLLGRRIPALVTGPALLLMLVGTVVTAFSGMPAIMIAAGLITGFGSGAAIGAAVGGAAQMGTRRVQMFVILGVAMFAGLVTAPLVSWLIASVMSWRIAYLTAIPLILIALVVTVAGGAVSYSRRTR